MCRRSSHYPIVVYLLVTHYNISTLLSWFALWLSYLFLLTISHLRLRSWPANAFFILLYLIPIIVHFLRPILCRHFEMSQIVWVAERTQGIEIFHLRISDVRCSVVLGLSYRRRYVLIIVRLYAVRILRVCIIKLLIRT